MKRVLNFLLKTITSLVISKYNPTVVAVTGSVGKTSTKEAVHEVFKDIKRIRKSAGNLNTETGAPLVFLKESEPGKGIKGWIRIILRGLRLIIFRDPHYPEIVVVELAADKPGDISYLANFIKPDIAVITAVGEVPVHIEFYRSAQEVAKEKSELLKNTKSGGFAILNADDDRVSGMRFDGKKITFGFSDNADVVVKEFHCDSFEGTRLKLSYKGEVYSLFLPLCIGDSFAYIGSSVFAVGITLGVSPEKIAKRLERIRPAKGRLYPIKGKGGSMILDGSYNAAPSSMESALRTLRSLPGKRKIAVLGDMLELGEYSSKEHQKIGREAAKFCDYVLSVGSWAGEVKKGAIKEGMNKEKVMSFSDSESAAVKLQKIISSHDLILVKGSQAMRTEKIVLFVMRDPERAEELLVRQSKEWKEA